MRLKAFVLLLATSNITLAAVYVNSPMRFKGAECVTEPTSKIKVCSEEDGHHLRGVSPNGKLLWRTNPFAAAKLAFYRVKNPKIVWLGLLERPVRESGRTGPFIGVTFESTQFGAVDVATGNFIFLGQD